MNKEELYNLAINNVQKYSLLNEIFAIRDKRVEQVDYTIAVNGFISLDSLNKYVEIIDYINQLKEENRKLNEEIQHIKYEKMQLLTTANNIRYTYGLR